MATQTLFERITTSMLPPAPVRASDRPGPTPELKAWLHRGWEALCSACGRLWHAVDVRPGDARCPHCQGLPTKQSALAAVESMPQPETDRYNTVQGQQAMAQAARVQRERGGAR